MLGMPLAACVYQNYLVISRENSIDFFAVKNLDSQYEMERKTIASANFMTLDFLVIDDKFIVASDIQQALIVYKSSKSTTTTNNNNNNEDVDDDDEFAGLSSFNDQLLIEKVAQDYSPKQLTYLAFFDGKIFAASLSATVYAYSFDGAGSIAEIGAFQCCSQVMAFAARENNLFYGTSSGGIGVFTISEDNGFTDLQAALESDEEIKILADRNPIRQFQWDQPQIFVDFDNLKILNNLSERDLNQILTEAKVDHKTYMKIFE